MSTLRIWLVGVNGDLIEFTEFSGLFRRLPGARGFGIPPTFVSMVEGAGEGSRHRFTRKGARDLDVPILIMGDTRAEVFAAQRRLSNALRFRSGVAPARLYFTAGDGVDYSTAVHYVAGAETQFGDNAGETFTKWLLTLRCPDPFWTAQDAVSIPPLQVSSATTFLPYLASLNVASSQVIGSILVENPGDVDSYPVWMIRGPGDSATLTRQDGQAFSLGAILASETITVDTKTASVTDQTGANRYALLGAAPKLFTLPGGSTSVSVQVVNATSGTLVQCFYKPRVEVVV